MNSKTWISIIVFFFLIIWVLKKERSELGCVKNFFSLEKQCIEEDSVFLVGTKRENRDSKDILFNKLKSILSHHEKGAVWRRSILIATIITLVFFLFTRFISCDKTIISLEKYFFLFIVMTAIIYFYHNYMNYHYYRRLKNNGTEIIDILQNK